MNNYPENIQLPKQLEECFFLHNEYCKRSFEELASEEEFYFVVTVLNEMLEKYNYIDIYKLIAEYEKNAHGEVCNYNQQISSMDIDDDIVFKLYNVSKEWKVYAVELIEPVDMKTLFNELQDKNFRLPFVAPFSEEEITRSAINEYGYAVYLSQNKELVIRIDFSNKYKKQENLINKISYEICIFKYTNNIEMTDIERNFLKQIANKDKSSSYRSSSFYNRIIGLYIWDILKKNQRLTFKEIRDIIVKEGIYKYKKEACSFEKCSYCESNEGCLRVLTENYKVAAASILQKRIIPTSEKVDLYKPQNSRMFGRHYIKEG